MNAGVGTAFSRDVIVAKTAHAAHRKTARATGLLER
jgi:hypothetical protein